MKHCKECGSIAPDESVPDWIRAGANAHLMVESYPSIDPSVRILAVFGKDAVVRRPRCTPFIVGVARLRKAP